MSEQRRTKKEYLEKYANDRCNGNVEEALTHYIVKEALKELGDDDDASREISETDSRHQD